MFANLKTLFLFFSSRYLQKVKEVSRSITRSTLKSMIDFVVDEYASTFGQRHWSSFDLMCERFCQKYPVSVHWTQLPRDILGLFVPKNHGPKNGSIFLNNRNSPGMHLSTIAHESGHLAAYLYRLNKTGHQEYQERAIYARGEELTVSLQDPEELLADFWAAMGSYPQNSFKKVFCNSQGKVYWIYRHSVLALFVRAMMYVTQHYPVISRDFLFCSNKFYHLCLTLHLIRLRVFIYENYQL